MLGGGCRDTHPWPSGLPSVTRAVTFAVLLVTVIQAHRVADHVLGQTDAQAQYKSLPGRVGWAALARHLLAYHLVLAVMAATALAALQLHLSPLGAACGMAVSVGTHALWDRRRAVRWLLVRTGARQFADLADNGMNGMYLADQSLHGASLWLAVLVAVSL